MSTIIILYVTIALIKLSLVNRSDGNGLMVIILLWLKVYEPFHLSLGIRIMLGHAVALFYGTRYSRSLFNRLEYCTPVVSSSTNIYGVS